jgi:hypothetical protein
VERRIKRVKVGALFSQGGVRNFAYKGFCWGVFRARTNKFATDDARHVPPRAVRMPRWFSA